MTKGQQIAKLYLTKGYLTSGMEDALGSDIDAAIAHAVETEREACAKLAEACHGAGAHMLHNRVIATALRARRQA